MQEQAAIHLPVSVRAEMIAHATEEAPRECCGLLVGQGSNVDESVRVRNVHPSPSRYLLDPAEHIATNRRLRGTGREVIGAYHSHPHSPAVPSPVDRAEAYYSDFVWIIVSLAVEGEPAVAAYRLRGGTFVPLALLPKM